MHTNRTHYSNGATVDAARKNTALIVLAFGIGAGFGAAAGLLFAPISGHHMRENLTNGLEHGLERGVSKGHEMLDPTLKRAEIELAELRKTVEDKVGELHNV